MSEAKQLVVADREPPDVMTDLQRGPWAMTQIDPKVELAKFEAAAELQRKLVPASIRATKPQDWIKMGDKVYLQATGVERIASLWGLVFGEPDVSRENYEDGNFAYVVTGAAGSRLTGVFYRGIQGGRSSADPFFDAFDTEKPQGFRDLPPEQREAWKREHRIAPDPLDVRKAAVTNWQVRAASMLTGLRGLTPKDLADAGVSGVLEVQYGKGARGGDTTPGDLKAESTALWNDILKRTGGELATAKQVLKDITAYPAKEGKYSAFPGLTSHDGFKDLQKVRMAVSKLKGHPAYGDAATAAEPGSEG